VQKGRGVEPWKQLTNQVFLGSDTFVERHLAMLTEQEGDLTDIPKKQQRKAALSLPEYERLNPSRNDAIKAAYSSGAYTLKSLGDYFGLHYSRISRIVAKGKT